MKKIVLLFCFFTILFYSKAQKNKKQNDSINNDSINKVWPLRYISLKINTSNAIVCKAPNVDFSGRYLLTRAGKKPVFKNAKNTLSTGGNIDILLNKDFGCCVGMATGLQIGYYNIAYSYTADVGKFKFTERNSVFSLGIPLILKVGDVSYDDRYIYMGAQYNWNVAYGFKHIIKNDKKDYLFDFVPIRKDNQGNCILNNNLLLIMGFSYTIGYDLRINIKQIRIPLPTQFAFNIEFNCMLKHFINTDFIDENGVKPYVAFSNNPVYFLKAGIHIPFPRYKKKKNKDLNDEKN